MKLFLLTAAMGAMAPFMLLQPAATSSAQQPVKQPVAPAPQAQPAYRVLVFSKTAGFRHDSIPQGIEAIRALGKDNGFAVDATEDSAQFTADNLDKYAAVVFLSTTGDILDNDQQAAFEAYIAKGRGYVGLHAAADTEYEWPWYGQLVGAYFKSHPQIQEAVVKVEDKSHPSTSHLPEEWKRTDEWYNYKQTPRDQVHVLAALDEKSYKGGEMGDDHPTAWCHEFGGGRAWYTGGGHTKESYSEENFLKHVLGGIQWAAGKAEWAAPMKEPANIVNN